MKHLKTANLCILIFLSLGISTTLQLSAENLIYPEKGYVRIVRDTYGVPHVYASNNRDVYFGFGYAQAEDRLEQLSIVLYAAAGRSAEVMGEERIGLDTLLRSFQHKKHAKRMKKRASREEKIILKAYCAGVNAYIKEHRSKLPAWIKNIKPIDIAYLGVASNIFDSASSLSSDYYNIGQGSNAFAIAGYHSTSGHAMLSYDSHSSWLNPTDKYYELHISTPTYFCVGNTNPGAPVFNNGFNGKIAWAGTANSPDIADILKFQVNAKNSQYLSRSGWKPIQRWQETIKVKTANGLQNQVITLRSTEDGPVWALENGYVYVCKVPEFIDTPELFKYAFKRVTVGSVLEFIDLFRTANYIAGHKFAADLQGNIGYIYAAPWPKRNPDLDWSQPIDGTDPRTEWLGYVSFEELPKVFNPASGWLQNCNGDPQYVTLNSGITSDLPGRLNFPGFGKEGKRLTELLSKKSVMRVKDMVAFSLDTLVWKARFWAPVLVNAFDAHADAMALRGTDTEAAINLFRNWNYRAEKTSKAMTVFHYFYDRFNTFPYWGIISVENAEQISESAKSSLLTELGEAAASVKSHFGRIDIPWSNVQYFKHGSKEYPLAGSGGSGGWLQTLRSTANQELQDDGRISVTGGSAYQYIIELSDSPKMWSGIPVGESEDPTSKHFNDLTQLFSNKKYKPVWYAWDKLAKHIESDVTISTKKRR